MSSVTKAPYTLWMGGIPLDWRVPDVATRFGLNEGDVRVVRERYTLVSKGCCFVDFFSKSAAIDFVKTLNGKVVLGKALTIKWEKGGP